MKTLQKYFDLDDDLYIPGRWHVKSPVNEQGEEVDPWQFTRGLPVSIDEKLILQLAPPGLALDFSLTELSVPIVSGRVVSLFKRLGLQEEVQFIPAQVQGHQVPCYILNVLQVIPCIDDARCEEVLYWLPEDERPDKVGQYRNVVGMRIDPEKAGSANVFRPWGWRVALIVSERVKLAMEKEGITGPKFTEV